MPVRMSLVPNLVTQAQLQSALASNSISFNLSRFIGPAIAGLMIATTGVASAFALNAVSYVAILTALLMVQLRPSSERKEARNDVWREMKDGFVYVIRHPRIRPLLLIIGAGSVLGRGPLELLPAYADAIFSRGSDGLAILTSAIGGGAVVAGLILARGADWLRLEVIAIGIVLAGLLLVVLGASDSFWLTVTVVAALGCMLSLCGVGSQILLQTIVEDEVRGRVSSLWGMVAFGGVALGGLTIGGLASLYGLREVTLGTGVLCAMLVGAVIIGARRRHRKQAIKDILEEEPSNGQN